MAKKFKLRLVGGDRKVIAGSEVTVHGNRFAVYNAPYDDLAKSDPSAWLEWAKKCAALWPKEKTGLELVMVPHGAELDVVEIIEDDGE